LKNLLCSLMLMCSVLLSGVPALAQDNNSQDCIETYDSNVDYFPEKVDSEYSEVWDVEYFNNYKVLTTHPNVRGEGDDEMIVLVQCGTPAPELTGDLAEALVIETPIDRIFDATGVGLPGIEALGVAETLVGWQYEYSGAEYLPEIYARRDELIAAGYGANLESVVAVEPDVYLIFGSPDERDEQRSLGIPAIWFDTWTDEPLGAAEQTKFISLFYNLEAEANALFDETEARYQELLQNSRLCSLEILARWMMARPACFIRLTLIALKCEFCAMRERLICWQTWIWYRILLGFAPLILRLSSLSLMKPITGTTPPTIPHCEQSVNFWKQNR
jgi:iron complex transport system substrate-binding protein